MFDTLEGLSRSHSCNELRAAANGVEVVLMGWVQRRRDHGGLIFVDLRDREGLTQVVFNPEVNPDTHIKAGVLRDEYVIAVRGLVNLRPPEMINPNLPTGEIEVMVEELRILNAAKTPPFELEDYKVDISEALRLKYRYLDLRRPSVMKNILFRHRAAQVTRQFLNGQGFIEVETPILTKSTPEGARDYLVPSRVQPGQFFALPQSPQLFKQLLMMAGLDRYYQLCRCFRDEDLRADRQPEFTQIDMEMAFITEADVYRVVEGLIAALFRELKGIDLATPFSRLTYQECMDRFGLDRPDTRFGLELADVTDLVRETEFTRFREVVDQGGIVKAVNGPGLSKLSRKELDELIDLAGVYGARGLAWVKLQSQGWQSPLAKYFPAGAQGRDRAPPFGQRRRPAPLCGRYAPGGLHRHGAGQAQSGRTGRADPRGHLPPDVGSPIFPCWSTTPPRAASRPCITRLRPPRRRTSPCWPPTRGRSGPGLTTWCSTAWRSAAAASASTVGISSSRFFRC